MYTHILSRQHCFSNMFLPFIWTTSFAGHFCCRRCSPVGGWAHHHHDYLRWREIGGGSCPRCGDQGGPWGWSRWHVKKPSLVWRQIRTLSRFLYSWYWNHFISFMWSVHASKFFRAFNLMLQKTKGSDTCGSVALVSGHLEVEESPRRSSSHDSWAAKGRWFFPAKTPWCLMHQGCLGLKPCSGIFWVHTSCWIQVILDERYGTFKAFWSIC